MHVIIDRFCEQLSQCGVQRNNHSKNLCFKGHVPLFKIQDYIQDYIIVDGTYLSTSTQSLTYPGGMVSTVTPPLYRY